MKAKTTYNGEALEGVALKKGAVFEQQQDRAFVKVTEMFKQATELASELGTPLNVLSGRTEALVEATQEEQTKRGLKIILEQAERLTRIRAQLIELGS
jgi:signal transduction histidine kinase